MDGTLFICLLGFVFGEGGSCIFHCEKQEIFYPYSTGVC